MLRDAEENYSEREFGKFEGLMEYSGKPLFPGLSSVLELLKLKASNGWSDKSFTALLGLLADILLDRKSTRLNSSHNPSSRMPSSA